MLITAVSFKGNCNDAIAFYQKSLGAKVKSIAHFKDAPTTDWAIGMDLPPDYVMDSEVIIDGQSVMMTDGATGIPTADFFSFCLIKDTEEQVREVFGKLADGGKIIEALAPVFWSSLYGVVEDKFGFCWMIMTSQEYVR